MRIGYCKNMHKFFSLAIFKYTVLISLPKLANRDFNFNRFSLCFKNLRIII